MFQTIKRAGLTIAEFAFLLGVSRVAVYNWKAGRTRPHKLLKERIKQILTTVEALTFHGKLPMRAELNHKQRRERLEQLWGPHGSKK